MARKHSSFDNKNLKSLISQYKLYKDIPCEDIKDIMKDAVSKLKVRDKISVYDVFTVLSNEDEVLSIRLKYNRIKNRLKNV